jgi:hypothetical protein
MMVFLNMTRPRELDVERRQYLRRTLPVSGKTFLHFHNRRKQFHTNDDFRNAIRPSRPDPVLLSRGRQHLLGVVAGGGMVLRKHPQGGFLPPAQIGGKGTARVEAAAA